MARFYRSSIMNFFFFIARRLRLDSDVTSAPKGANLNHKRLTTVFINQPFGNGWGQNSVLVQRCGEDDILPLESEPGWKLCESPEDPSPEVPSGKYGMEGTEIRGD